MNTPIHVAITHVVKPGCEERFEKAILTFFVESLRGTTNLGAQLLRPLPGSKDRRYGILRSFASEEDREAFYRSDRFTQWERAVEPLVEEEYSRRDLHGLEAFFSDPDLAQQPPRWKMAFVTWLGVWPTVFVVSALAAQGLLSGWPVWLAAGVDTLAVVIILTWGVMPALTRLLRPWLETPMDAPSRERSRS